IGYLPHRTVARACHCEASMIEGTRPTGPGRHEGRPGAARRLWMGWRWMAVVACVATSAAASATVLCKTSTGLVAVRDACKRGETQLDPVALGLQGPPGPKGDPGMQGPQGLPGPAAGVTVRDATGAIVGAWKPEPANAGQAVMTLSGHAVALPV